LAPRLKARAEPDVRSPPANTGRPSGRTAADDAPPPRLARTRRGLLSPLTRRILTVNVLALAILVAGLLYLGRYQENLIHNELQALRVQAEILAGALGTGAHGTTPDGAAILRPEAAGPMLKRLVEPTGARARLFADDGELIADSRVLTGPGGAVQVERLPPPDENEALPGMAARIYEWVLDRMPARQALPVYLEHAEQRAADYEEAVRAIAGESAWRVRVDGHGGLVLSVAIPVQRFKQVLGALMLSETGEDIDEAVRDVRLDILRVFLVSLAVTVLLSLYLAGTIVRPLRRLALAADRVRRARGRGHDIPDFRGRHDEIGALAGDLRDMTEALRMRLDAIERFAADVAHEIKNPLTSLKSAVETAARVRDPDQQRRLMAIILEDVERLNRLITDISDASRLDAELSRLEPEPIDLGRLLSALVEVHRTAAREGRAGVAFEDCAGGSCMVMGIESRLVQVFQNLLTNAFSFSPPGGTVTVRIGRSGAWIEAVVEDGGPGIPEGSLEKIFDRFYSERPEGERFGTHSGLGLSISRQIVESQGGTISAANRRDSAGAVCGARFTVRLPAV
jgi:two-component system sensor histidine kinase ChvG